MALFEFGGTIADFGVLDGTGHAVTLLGGATVTFWSAKTGGTQYTVYDDIASTNPGTSRLTSDGTGGTTYGTLPTFFASAVSVWASANGSPRLKMISNDVTQALSGGPRAVKIVTGVTGATTIDWSQGTTWDITLVGPATLSFINFPVSGVPVNLTLVVRQDATGGRTITWPTTIAWDDATLPIQNATASAADLYRFYTHDGGTTVFGQQDGRSKSAAPTGSSLPYGILDLTKWYLGAPVDANGGTTGTSRSIKRPELETFSDPVYFHANTARDGVVFAANCGGARTSANTTFARSELREMTGSDGLTNASWGFGDGLTHTLTVTFSVDELPQVKPEVVIGQIHDADDDVLEIEASGFYPLTGTTIVNQTDTAAFAIGYKFYTPGGGSSFDQTTKLITNYTLGTKATYKVVVNTANGLRIYADLGATATTLRKTIASGWPVGSPEKNNDTSAGCYFKAGCYTQSNTTNTNKDGSAKTVPHGTCAGGADLTSPAAGSALGGDLASARGVVTIYSVTHTHV